MIKLNAKLNPKDIFDSNLLTNLSKSKPDNRDYKFVASPNAKALINTVTEKDLRIFNRDMENQLNQGACTAFSTTNPIEIITEQRGQYENLSSQFQFYTTRDLSGILHLDGTYSMRDCLEAARRFGICLESEWPYDYANKDVRPPESAYASAATRKITRYEALDLSKSQLFGTDYQLGIDNIKAALNEDLPVMFSMPLGQKFPGISGPLATHNYPLLDFPDEDTGNKYIGSHAMTIVGYSDLLGGFIVENQWGPGWGDNGYFLLKYASIRDLNEAWVIRGYKDIDLVDPVLSAARKKIVRLYVATLGRSPELSGFKWWVSEVISGANIDGAAQGFLESEESRARFPNNGRVVNDIVQNLNTFNNKCAVAEYFVVDLACDKVDLAKISLNLVTENPASIEIAKKYIRERAGKGVI